VIVRITSGVPRKIVSATKMNMDGCAMNVIGDNKWLKQEKI